MEKNKIPSVGEIFKSTKSFFLFRIMVYGAFALMSIAVISVLAAICIGLTKIFEDSTGLLLLIGFVMIVTILGFIHWARRYVLYLVKAGHVSVISKYIVSGEKAEKGNINYCKEVVKTHFKEVSIGAGADALIEGAVRQIMKWLTKIGNFFSFIPGSEKIINLITTILSIACNYIDEAILSYIFITKEGSSWQKARDGIVLYAKSWKELLKTATIISILLLVIRTVAMIVFTVMFAGIFSNIVTGFGFVLGLITAALLVVILEGALFEPLCTISMIRAFLISIQDKTTDSELMDKLTKASNKFKTISEKANNEITSSVV